MFRIVLTHPQDNADVERNFIPKGASLEVIPCPSEEDLIRNLKDVDAVISAYEPFTERVLQELPRLKIISQASIGVNSVDLDAAKDRGIAVINNPHYCTPEVADHTMALILALNRKLLNFNKAVQQDHQWRYDLFPDIVRLSELTLGLFGFGNIAREVAKRASAFNMKIVTTDPYINLELAEELGVEVVSPEELYERSDIVSIHAPLIKETENLFNLDVYKKMKRCPLIINCGRGPIVNEDDLAKALELGYVSGAGLDVLKEEDPNLEKCSLVGRDDVILTPHVAYYSKTSQYEIQKMSAYNIKLYLDKEYDKLSIVNNVRL